MAPAGLHQNLHHRIRRASPMRPTMALSLALMERASRETITRYQERRLRMLVRIAAARAPYYRQWFRDSGVDPRSIRTLADLPKLPLLDRSLLVEDADQFRVYPRQFMWATHSSGTTGACVTCYRTPGSSSFELTALERQWKWFGLRPGARRVVLRGSSFAADQDGAPTKLVPGARQLLVSSYSLAAEHVTTIVSDIHAFAPDAIEGWPSSITLLASLLRDRGLTIPVRAVITSSEAMTTGQLSLMRGVFRGPIVDHYGQTERVAMAGTCEVGRYHVFPDYGIVELLPIPGSSDRWEIVGTPLHNWGFPLFRYRTGDQVGPADQSPCRCGRAFDSLGRVDGRVEDSFTAADGRLLPLPSTAIDDLANIREVQIAQLEPGRFEIRVVPGPGFNLTATQAHARQNVDRLFGVEQEVSVRVLDTLPRTAAGKLKNSVVESVQPISPRG
jgi:phenylacetate-CoA ligase